MSGCADTASPVTKRLYNSSFIEQFTGFTPFQNGVGLKTIRVTAKRRSVTTAGGGAPVVTFKL